MLLVTDLQPGGAPLRLAALARGLRAAGVDVHVGCLADAGPVSRMLDAEGIPTFACRARTNRDLGAVLRLLGHVRRIGPDLIHSTLTHANVSARLVGGYLGVPVLSSTATIEMERAWHLRLERWTARWDRGHIVSGKAIAAHVIDEFRVPMERVFVVPAFVESVPRRIDRAEARRIVGVPADAFVLAWAGRLDPVKRVDLLLDLVAMSANGRSDERESETADERDPLPSSNSPRETHLLLAGDGPMRTSLESLLCDHPSRERVHFLGWQEDLSAVYSAADVFVFPSLTEGMPNAVLSAMAFGLPVIGSDIPALRELAGAEGRLVLAGHTRQQFAVALTTLRVAIAARERLADASRAWAEGHLSREGAVRAVLDIYERVVRPSNRSAARRP